MLEQVVFDQEPLDKETYKVEREQLLKELPALQFEAHQRGIGVVVLFEGWNGAGKGSRISDLMYNLDARSTSVFLTPDMDMKAAIEFPGREHGVNGFYPMMQQFWNALGPRGNMTFYDRGWYYASAQRLMFNEFGSYASPEALESLTKADRKKLTERKNDLLAGLKQASFMKESPLTQCLESAEVFERQLVDDDYVVIKFFVHVRKEAQKKRLERMLANPETSWRVSPGELERVESYDDAYQMYDNLLEHSDFWYAPWVLLNGEDKRRANLTITKTLVDALKKRLNEEQDATAAAAAAKAQANSAGKLGGPEGTPEERYEASKAQAALDKQWAPKHSRYRVVRDYPSVEAVDHTLVLPLDEYREQRKFEQQRLDRLQKEAYQRRIPVIAMFEGWDAAGKGGAIKRVAQALDARAYTIFPSPAPTKPELLHPHLWRYWTRLPKAGHVGIYDRSWYGRVLVERVEGFASPEQWGRAYDEINEFELALVRWGAVLLKFWVDIDPDEQLRRFEARQADPAKQFKITDEDWRNREKYPQYKAAVDDMFRLTSTTYAPWVILESDDKPYARIKALKTINDALEKRLNEVL